MIQDLLYGPEPKIHSVYIEDNEVPESSQVIGQGWGHVGSLELVNEVKNESFETEHESKIESVEEVKGSEHEYYTALEAANMNTESIDMRPHLHDKKSGVHYLIDSGASVSAIPPDPGDIPDPRYSLKAINGNRLRSYGWKEIDIQIGRKQYRVRAAKTDVKYPVLGYDFTRKHVMEIGWSDFGDAVLRDKRSQIETILKYKGMPRKEVEGFSSLHIVPTEPEPRDAKSDPLTEVKNMFRTFNKPDMESRVRTGVTGQEADRMIFELHRPCHTCLCTGGEPSVTVPQV